MQNKLLAAKQKKTSTHNTDLQDLVDKVQKEKSVPFQVLLNEDLATRVKIFSATNKLTHKEIVTLALEKFLTGK
jgi:hypothetical protein